MRERRCQMLSVIVGTTVRRALHRRRRQKKAELQRCCASGAADTAVGGVEFDDGHVYPRFGGKPIIGVIDPVQNKMSPPWPEQYIQILIGGS